MVMPSRVYISLYHKLLLRFLHHTVYLLVCLVFTWAVIPDSVMLIFLALPHLPNSHRPTLEVMESTRVVPQPVQSTLGQLVTPDEERTGTHIKSQGEGACELAP